MVGTLIMKLATVTLAVMNVRFKEYTPLVQPCLYETLGRLTVSSTSVSDCVAFNLGNASLATLTL